MIIDSLKKSDLKLFSNFKCIVFLSRRRVGPDICLGILLDVCKCICTRAYTNVRIYAYVYTVYWHTYTPVYIHAWTAYTRACIRTYIRICMHTYIIIQHRPTYTHARTRTSTRKHTQRKFNLKWNLVSRSLSNRACSDDQQPDSAYDGKQRSESHHAVGGNTPRTLKSKRVLYPSLRELFDTSDHKLLWSTLMGYYLCGAV